MKNAYSLALLLSSALCASFAPGEEVAARLLLSKERVYATRSFSLSVEIEVPELPAPNADVNPVYSSGSNGAIDMPLFPGERRMTLNVDCDWFLDDAFDSKIAPGKLEDLLGRNSRQVWTLSVRGNTVTIGPFSNAAKFPLASRHENGKWIYTVAMPDFTAREPGEVSIPPARVTIPVIKGVDRFGRYVCDFKTAVSKPAKISVASAPADGRPKSYCGVIAEKFTASVAIKSGASAGVKQFSAGDILTLELCVESSGDLSRMAAPELPKSEFFKVSGNPKQMPSSGGTVVWQWRLRPVLAGTTEFPSIPVSYFDPVAETYVDAGTSPIPVQIAPAAQAVLGDADDSEAWPMPDGLLEGDGTRRVELPGVAFSAGMLALAALATIFAIAGICLGKLLPRVAMFVLTAATLAAALAPCAKFQTLPGASPFSWERAMALASRAAGENDFKRAAGAFRECIAAGADNPEIWKNLGGALYFAGDYIASRDAYLAAERFAGADDNTRRGLVAAYARLKNDPSAELPLDRQLLRPWCALGEEGKLRAAAACWIFLCMAAIFVSALSARSSRRALMAVFAAFVASRGMAAVGITAKFEPEKVFVGENVSLVFECTVPRDVTIEDWNTAGLPESFKYGGPEELGGAVETPSNAIRRICLSGRFTEPFKGAVRMVSQGAETRREVRGNFSSEMKNLFILPLSASVEVEALPEDGRPADFSGAVGDFRLSQSLSRSEVRPGDLVDAVYTLEFDGYLPEDAMPAVSDIPAGAKAYEVREISRDAKSAVWKQTFHLQNTNALHSAKVSFGFFNTSTRAYDTTAAEGLPLHFTSGEPAPVSTPDVVAVDGAGDVESGEVVKVRFGPGEHSPVLFTIRPDEAPSAPGWHRISTPRGEGWVKCD